MNSSLEAHGCGLGTLTRGTLVTQGSGPNTAHGVAVQGASKPYNSLFLRHATSGGVVTLETPELILLLHIWLFSRLYNGVV